MAASKLIEDLRMNNRKLMMEVAALKNQVATFNMLERENRELRRRQEWLERRVNELEMSDVARV